jgi:WhiB family redox-sensing transcriptional regulator
MRPLIEDPTALRFVDLVDGLAANAECRFDPELHTGPDGGESVPERQARTDAARDMCAECPVWNLCLEYALRLPSNPTTGVWAGYSPAEIAELRTYARRAGSDVGQAAA